MVRLNTEIEAVSLVDRIIAGDTEAEAALVRSYRPGINIIIERIVRNKPVTEDIAQETFRIVLEKVRHGDLREPAKLKAFVCSVARNAALDHIRRVARYPLLEDIARAAEVRDPGPDPLDAMLKQEMSGIVHQVIAELSLDRDRQLLLRYFVAEEDKDSICRDLGLTRIQFSNILYRSLARFKDLLIRALGES